MPVGRATLYLATAAALALAVRSLLWEPPGLGVALGVLGGYVAIVVLGVLFSRFGMFADVLTRGPRGARGVALTFDDGPDPATTTTVLDALDAAGARATFFVIGRKAEQHPELLAEIVARGHAVGVHGYEHDRLFALRSVRVVRHDLERALQALERITGEHPTLLRPPVGHVSPPVARVARELDLVIVGWSVRALDGWSRATRRGVLSRVLPKLRDRGIVALHDAAERGNFVPASVGALEHILTVAARRGLSFVTLDEWLRRERP